MLEAEDAAASLCSRLSCALSQVGYCASACSFWLRLQGAYLLLGLVGVGILLPLIAVVIYLSNSSKYTGNNIMHATLGNYYHLMKPSLAPRYSMFSRSSGCSPSSAVSTLQ